MTIRLCLLFTISLSLTFSAIAERFDVTAFGAKPTSANNAPAIQAAIDKASGQGGGEVIIPAGTFITGFIKLKSNVGLVLEHGATLAASRNPADYSSENSLIDNGVPVPILIYADKAENISISGMGQIDGRAEHTYLPMKEVDNYIKVETEIARAAGVEMSRYYAVQPLVRCVYIVNCKNVRLSQFTIRNSPNWTLHTQQCDGVVFDQLSVFSSLERGVNADGLDIDDCRNVRVSGCHIETGDDAICLKSTYKKGAFTGCENITISNCTLVSTSTALKIGTESWGYFRNIVFTGCAVRNTNRGFGIFVRDGAHVSDIVVTDLAMQCNRKHFNWWGDGDPIHIVVQKRTDTSRVGSVRNILLANILAKGQGTSLISSIVADSISGITLQNVSLQLEPEQTKDHRATSVLAFRNVSDARIAASTAKFLGSQAGWTYGLDVANCKYIKVEGSDFTPPIGQKEGIYKVNCSNCSIRGPVDNNRKR